MSKITEDVRFIENLLNRKPDWKFWLTNNLIFMGLLFLGIQFGGPFTVVVTGLNLLNLIATIPIVAVSTYGFLKLDLDLMVTILEASKNIPSYVDRLYDITILVIFFTFGWNWNFAFYIGHMILLEIYRFNYSNIKDYINLLLQTAKQIDKGENK